jgi:3'(2'), 5'-bisphosphate nucleotidase
MSLTDAAVAAELARDAGELLLEVREEIGFWDPYDLGDAGDKRANTLILDGLARLRPGDAVLSEEAVDDLSRVHADRVWIVDPLDGTWEFSVGRNDWAVHIALWQRDGAAAPAVLGPGGPDGGITDAAVALPAFGEVFRTDTVTSPSPRRNGPIRITASANRPPAVLWRLRDQMDIELIRIGSAGAKAMAVVNGDVDAYLHAGGQWEWDSAAPAGVVWAAGLHASRLDGSPLIYNRRDPYLPDLLMCRAELADELLTGIRSAVRGRSDRTP